MTIENFNFSYPIQMRWNDMDALGHVNNGLYVTYFEMARGHYMPTACKGWDWHKHMFLIGSVQVDFLRELKLTDQNTRVHVRTSKLGGKSFVLEYLITSEKNSELFIHATGSTVQVMFDMTTRTTIEIPDWVRKGLRGFDTIDV